MNALARRSIVAALVTAVTVLAGAPAGAGPVCTDGYMGGPAASVCGGRIFPEPEVATSYVQYSPRVLPHPTYGMPGFIEYQHGIEYLAQQYPRWVSVTSLDSLYGEDAVSAGLDDIRPYEDDDTGDGQKIWVIKVTDHDVPDEGKIPLYFSLSVHGNERGGLEGGLRAAEDLAMWAEDGETTIADRGELEYESTTGRPAERHEHSVADVLAQEVVYFVEFNVDGWYVGDRESRVPPGAAYTRGNAIGTDLNRQMPTTGRINATRNPLEESEMLYGVEHMHDVAETGPNGLMGYAADVHGELNSNAYIDIMYPAGEFDSVDHRRLMAIAERTKSDIDERIYGGIINEIENTPVGGGDGSSPDVPIPVKPAHWATVFDTLGYTDTGFIGDYMATDLAVTGMDYEIFLNHTVPMNQWTVYLQHNHINGTRGIIFTAMAYVLFQEEEFNDENVVIDTLGHAGYVLNPDTVSNDDANGVGRPPGPNGDYVGANGDPLEQDPYDVTNQQWFRDTNRLMPRPFSEVNAADIANDPELLNRLDTLVLSDITLPADGQGRSVNAANYWANIKAWVERGGNLVLTDRGLYALADLGIVTAEQVHTIRPYLPFADFSVFDAHMTHNLRENASQLVESAALGYGIPNIEYGDPEHVEVRAPMGVVDEAAWEAAGGEVYGVSDGESDAGGDAAGVSVGELALGDAGGLIRIVGGVLPMPTEENDHRYGLRNYAPTYSGLFVLENAIQHDNDALGGGIVQPTEQPSETNTPTVAPTSTTSPGTGTPTVAPTATSTTPPPGGGGPLPTTGGGIALAALAVAGAAARLASRRGRSLR